MESVEDEPNEELMGAAASAPPPDQNNDEEQKSDDDDDDAAEESASSSDDDEEDAEANSDAPQMLDADGRPLSEYERLRLQRIQRNEAYLQQLGLHEVQPPKKSRPKKKEQRQPEAPLVKSRFSSRAIKKTSYTEPSNSVAALLRQEKTKKEPKQKKPPKEPKEPKPPREKKAQSRMERPIYDEFQRIAKHKKQVLKLAERDVKAAEKEIKFWSKRAGMLDRREQRKAEAGTREQQVDQERQVMGGFSKRDLLQQVDDRMDDIVALAEKYDEEFEAEELARERQVQRIETEVKNKLLDALDRFPKALHDSHALLSTIMLQRLPKDPPPPRRSRRSSLPADSADGGEFASGIVVTKKNKARQSHDDTGNSEPLPNQEWLGGSTFQETSLADVGQQEREEESSEVAPQATARIRTRSVRNVGGWISPNMAKLVDRSWLERDEPIVGKDLDLSSYAPQVGEAVLYYPLAHREFLAVHPDVLGKRLRSAQRVPLWERQSRLYDGDDDDKRRSEESAWWTQEWLESMNNGTANYPILCRVEKSYAEFPPDPFTKVMKKTGSNDDARVVWKAPKDPAVLKQANGAPMRLALILKPLTPVLPPQSTHARSYETLPLPPTFGVVTFPSAHNKPFILPFSYTYAIWHSLVSGQRVVHKKTKLLIKEFALPIGGETCRFDNMRPELHAVAKSVETANSLASFIDDAFSSSSKGLPARDCRAAIEVMQKYTHNLGATEGLDDESKPPDIMQIVARTLPLWNGVCVLHSTSNRKTTWISPWEIDPDDLWTENFSPDGLAKHGFDDALRRRIETVVEDFAWESPVASDLLYYRVTEDDAPSYDCAVPVGMSLERILTRFGNDSDSPSGCFYRSAEHVIADISLILENCLLYNAPDSVVVEAASITIPQLKEIVMRASQAYFQELLDARKADEERRKLVMSMGDEVPETASSEPGTLGPKIATLRQPYTDMVDQEWLQDVRPGCFWIPQAGDDVQYSPSRHATFIQGHYRSLGAEQCLIPSFFTDNSESAAVEWIYGKIAWTRACFPKAHTKRSSDDQMTFSANTTLLALGVQANATGGIFVLYYRPCCLMQEQSALRCPVCGLDNMSFLRQGGVAADATGPKALTVSDSARIKNCLSFLKRRCMRGESPSSLDPKLDKASVKQGYRIPKPKLALKNLPSFEHILFIGDDEKDSSSCKGTRGVKLKLVAKPACDNAQVSALSNSCFLPAWAAQVELLDRDRTISPWPKMSLELVLLRLKNAFYHDRAAISNDIIEAFVSSTSILLSEQASRKRIPLQAKRIIRLSTKVNIETLANEDDNEVFQEERILASRIKHIRELHAMALLSVAHTIHVERLFGLDDSVEIPHPDIVEKRTVAANKDPVREDARRKISALLDAVGKDQLLNVFGQKFHGERASIPTSKLSIICGGLPVCHPRYYHKVSTALAEFEDGRSLEVTIKANRKVVSKLKDLEEDENEDQLEEPSDIDAKVQEMRVSLVCGGKLQSKIGDKLHASVPGRLGDRSLVRKLEHSMYFGLKEYEASESLVKFVFGRPGRMEPCGRCQAFRRSFFTCRVRRSHSNPDYDWLLCFETMTGVDQLLATLDPSYTPKQEAIVEPCDGLLIDTVQTSKAKVDASVTQDGTKDMDDDDVQDDGENKDDDEDDVSDPREQLEKAKLALQYGRKLLKQAQEYCDKPMRLSKEFIHSVYPVDPSDNHYLYCIICGLSGDLLCCDGCSNVFHGACLALKNVPEDEWFCEECCSNKIASVATSEVAHDIGSASFQESLSRRLPGEPHASLASSSIATTQISDANTMDTQAIGAYDGKVAVVSTNEPLTSPVTALRESPQALVNGPFQRADFDDAAAEKLDRVLFDLNDARPERYRSKLRSEEFVIKEDGPAIKKSKTSLTSDEKIDGGSPISSPARKRVRMTAAERMASQVVRPVENIIELEASRFGRRRSRPQFLSENTMVGDFYASKGPEDSASPRAGTRKSRSNVALWDDPFDRLNANAQAFLGTLDISNAEEFLHTRTSDIADALINWRQKQKLPPLKGTGSIATVSGWKTLCRDAAKEMGMDTQTASTPSKERQVDDQRRRKRRRTTDIDSGADPIEGLSATAREFLSSVNIESAEALLMTKSSDLADELVSWRKEQGMPALKGTGSGATVSAWKSQCRKNMDSPEETTADTNKAPPTKSPTRKAIRAAEPESESDDESAEEGGENEALAGVIDAGDPLQGLPDYAQEFLASKGITSANNFLETKSSEIASVYVNWRKKHGMAVLKGSGPGAHIGAWKAIARKPIKSASKKRKLSSVNNESDDGADSIS